MTIQPAQITEFSSTKKTPVIYKVAVMLSMMTLIGGTLTAVMTYVNLGYTETFFQSWLSSFLMAVLVLMPTGFTVMALLTKLGEKFLGFASEKQRNFLISIIMACVMESIMAFITAANNIGFNDLTEFKAQWLKGFLTALPVALVLMMIIAITIKPKVEQFLKS